MLIMSTPEFIFFMICGLCSMFILGCLAFCVSSPSDSIRAMLIRSSALRVRTFQPQIAAIPLLLALGFSFNHEYGMVVGLAMVMVTEAIRELVIRSMKEQSFIFIDSKAMADFSGEKGIIVDLRGLAKSLGWDENCDVLNIRIADDVPSGAILINSDLVKTKINVLLKESSGNKPLFQVGGNVFDLTFRFY